MTPKAFCRLAIGFVGTPVEWKARVAHRLDRPLAEIEAWSAGSRPVPAAVAELLAAAAAPDAAALPDEWIRGAGLPPSNAPGRDYLVHARAPRFIARVLAQDEKSCRAEGDGRLAEIVWLDPEPDDGERETLIDAAVTALERGEARL